MARRKTNIHFIKHIMEYSKHGALMQAFIMQALNNMANAVVEAKPEELKNGLINPTAWKGCAQELQDALTEHFAS